MTKLLLLLCLSFSSLSLAYIPKTQTILKNITEKRSDSPLRIKKELVFATENDKFLVTETWYIKDSENFYVEAKGPGFSYTAIHQAGQRYRKNTSGQLVKSQPGLNFYFPLFVSNDPNIVGGYLVRSNILLPDVLKKTEPVYSAEQIEYTPEERIRLTRKDGIVHFGLGIPTEVEASKPEAQAWVEQDNFHLTKLRQSDFTVEASDFKRYGRAIDFPQKFLLKWDLFKVDMQTIKVETIRVGKTTKSKFEFDNLEPEVEVGTENVNPTLESVKKFYLKFR